CFFELLAELDEVGFENLRSERDAEKDGSDNEKEQGAVKRSKDRGSQKHPKEPKARQDAWNRGWKPANGIEHSATGKFRAHQNVADEGENNHPEDRRAAGDVQSVLQPQQHPRAIEPHVQIF